MALASWSRVNLLITTHCNLSCPECCYRIPSHETLPEEHYSWAYFVSAAEHLQGLDTLVVTGGEPTLHPVFDRVAREFRSLFNPQRMILATNGCALDPGLVQHFDSIEYGPTAHFPLSRYGGGGLCHRYGIAAVAGGQVWPCCVGPGLGAKSVALTTNWRDRLPECQVPCPRCCFSEPQP